MKIYSEEPLYTFEFWAGAVENARKLTLEEMEILDDYFSEFYPEGVSETEVNDWFWFYFDDILDILGKWAKEVFKPLK